MARYLDPKNDFIFKRIFGEHPHLLKSFLNALMPLDKDQEIVSLEYLPPEHVPENPVKKFSIVDVRCKDNHGRYFIVEMQMEWSNAFSSRMMHNLSITYSRQLDKKGKYKTLRTVFGLAILNDTFDKKTPEYYHHFQMANIKNTDEVLDNAIELVMIELPKFVPETMAEKRMAVLWLRFLRETEDNYSHVVSEDLLENEDIQTALTICEESAFTEEELHIYERHWEEIRNEQSLLSEQFDKGMAQGEQERQKLQQEIADKDKQIEELKRLLDMK